MDTVHSTSHRSNAAALASLMLIALPVMYVASLGPVFRLCEEQWLNEGALAFYLPLLLLAEQSDFIGELLDRYVQWWQW